METLKHTSTMISDSVYNDATNTLTITYAGGTEYTYTGVPSNVYENFKNSKSKGEFINDNMKDVYAYTKHEA